MENKRICDELLQARFLHGILGKFPLKTAREKRRELEGKAQKGH